MSTCPRSDNGKHQWRRLWSSKARAYRVHCLSCRRSRPADSKDWIRFIATAPPGD